MSMTEVVEESLKADPRFRHLTVQRDWLSQAVHELITSGDSLDFAEAMALMELERNRSNGK